MGALLGRPHVHVSYGFGCFRAFNTRDNGMINLQQSLSSIVWSRLSATRCSRIEMFKRGLVLVFFLATGLFNLIH